MARLQQQKTTLDSVALKASPDVFQVAYMAIKVRIYLYMDR